MYQTTNPTPAHPLRTHILRTGRLTVAAPVDRAFALFTPLGETRWVEGWNPTFHHPSHGEAQLGSVFTTGQGDGATHWVIVDWRPDEHRVRYARVTPGNRAGTVAVACRPRNGGVGTGTEAAATEVEVTYDLTATTDAGDAELATWTPEWFAGYLEEWSAAIARMSEV
jgi:hypothetical protein